MKLEKSILVALVSGLLVGLLLDLLGIFIIQDLYTRVSSMDVANWYIIITLILCLGTFIACIVIAERAQMEVIIVFIGSYIFVEIVIHVFTIIYIILNGLGWSMLLFMHGILIMVFVITLPAMLFFINYDKWRDPLIFLGAAILSYLLLSIVLIPFFSTNFQWMIITYVVMGMLAISIISVIIVQVEFT